MCAELTIISFLSARPMPTLFASRPLRLLLNLQNQRDLWIRRISKINRRWLQPESERTGGTLNENHYLFLLIIILIKYFEWRVLMLSITSDKHAVILLNLKSKFYKCKQVFQNNCFSAIDSNNKLRSSIW